MRFRRLIYKLLLSFPGNLSEINRLIKSVQSEMERKAAKIRDGMLLPDQLRDNDKDVVGPLLLRPCPKLLMG